jgi:4-amino-4-deoxy-L-arabinose transferase-like glycosyltransferase
MKISSYQLSWLNLLVFSVVVLKAILLLAVFPWLLPKLGNNFQVGLFPDGYGAIAANLIAGNGYRMFDDTSLTMLRPPAFVLILASLFLFFGKSLFAVQVMQLLMSLATAALIYFLANRLFRTQAISIAASLIFLFHPGVLIAETRGGIECTLMLCFTGCITLSYLALDYPRWRNFIYFGLAFGLTMLVKSSVAIYFPALVALALWRRPRGLSINALLGRFAVAGLASLLIMSPWIIRNYNISGQFVPTMTVGGLALFQGVYMVKNSESGKDSYVLLKEAADEQIKIAHEMNLKVHEDFFPQFYSPNDEINYYNQLGRLAIDDYRESPWLVLKAIGHNSWAFWFQGRTQRATILNIILTAPILILILWGSVIAIKATSDAWLLLIALFAFIAPHLLIISMARYYVILVPLISVLTAVSVVHCWQLLKMKFMCSSGG